MERERFCNPLPAVGLAGFPRGLLEEITDDDAITVMRCLTGGGSPIGRLQSRRCFAPDRKFSLV